MQFAESSTKGLCANPYCTRGKDGKPAEIAIRNIRDTSYCSQSCAAMARYKKRYKGTLNGAATKEDIKDKLKNL